MDTATLINLIIGALNAGFLLYAAWKKLKPEVKKMDAEGDIDVLKGAEISNQMLIDRINEMKIQRDSDITTWKAELQQEREARKIELEAEKTARKVELDAEREARRKEGEYLRRRIKEAEREARDYRQWAAKLVKQVVEAGKVPAPFLPSTSEDSETGISPITEEKGEK